jgi:hypothetical protein
MSHNSNINAIETLILSQSNVSGGCNPTRHHQTPKIGKTDMTEGYDKTAKLVNAEIAKLGDTGTFADLAGIDKKLRLPKGTSWEMGGYADYFAFEDD